MKFWDTSALIHLIIKQPQSVKLRNLYENDQGMVLWWATRVEFVSALARQSREQGMSRSGERQARHLLETLARTWTEVQPTSALRAAAERLLAVHALSAAEAFQLAAAWHWCQGQTRNASLVSFDVRLREAAYKEGFPVLPAE